MFALTRNARTASSAQPGLTGRKPVNAVTPGMQAQHKPAHMASQTDTSDSVLVSRRKRAKRRAGRG